MHVLRPSYVVLALPALIPIGSVVHRDFPIHERGYMDGVFMMRWNVVIGGQSFSLTFSGYMENLLPIIPHNLETLKVGLLGASIIGLLPFVLFWILNKIFPVFELQNSQALPPW